VEKEIFLTEENKKIFKPKLKKVQRPNWTKSQFRNANKLWLDKNENSDKLLLKETKKLFNQVNVATIFSYPDLSTLYKKLAKNLKVNPKNLLFTAGSDVGIKTVFDAFINEGDIVVRTNPTFAMYSVYSKIFNVKEILLDYEKTEQGPKINLKKIIKIILKKKPKLICLPNPDSPTGHSFSSEEIKTLLKKARKIGSLVLIDEAYYPFYPFSSKKFIKKFPNLIITRTTSKAWGLAGLRVGYVLSSINIIKEMHKVRPMYEINNIAAELFNKYLDKKSLVRNSVRRLLEGKKYFTKEMQNLGFDFFKKEEGNFIHVNFKNHREKILKQLSKRVYFRHNESHKSIANFSRFTLTSIENFKQITKIIKKTINR
jgi:histidinol-phosphate aminotransferase